MELISFTGENICKKDAEVILFPPVLVFSPKLLRYPIKLAAKEINA